MQNTLSIHFNEKITTQNWFKGLQKQICLDIESIEQKYSDTKNEFIFTEWQRNKTSTHDEGGGLSAILRGKLFEKAAVNFSCVFGEFSEKFRSEVKGAEQDPRFFATGVSVIIHPSNPHIPAIHMNTRFIKTTQSWFAGVIDLNPMIMPYRDMKHPDSIYFHTQIEKICKQHKCANYKQFKQNCDKYFWIKHRSQPRGVGGIFYEHLNSGDLQDDFLFTQKIGKSFSRIYHKIVEKNSKLHFCEKQKQQQLEQRAIYAEFNLIYDRGTRFGLQTGGNINAIFASLPPVATW